MPASISHSNAMLHYTLVPSPASKVWLHSAQLLQIARVVAPATTVEGPPKLAWAEDTAPCPAGSTGCWGSMAVITPALAGTSPNCRQHHAANVAQVVMMEPPP